MPFKLKYYILSFLPFFLLFYSESNSIGGLKISQLWKLPLLLFLIWYVFQKRHKTSPVWTQTYYWLSLKHLFNSGMVKQLLGNIQDGLTFLFLPWASISARMPGRRISSAVFCSAFANISF